MDIVSETKRSAASQYLLIKFKIVGAANTGQSRPKIMKAAMFAYCDKFLSSTILAQMAEKAAPIVR